MSILSAVTNVARECGYAVDTEVVASSDVTTRQLLSIANRLIREMADAYPWPKLFKSASITLVGSQATYALPADFSHYAFETWWNQSDQWRVLGPLTQQEYAELIGYELDATPYDRFQIRGVTDNQILIYPTPDSSSAGQVIIFEYSADRPVRPRTWAAGQSITTGDYTFYNGNYYVSQTTATAGATPPTHTSSTASDGAVTWEYYSGPYSTFIADTDEPVLPQRILEQGMLERFAEIKGLTVSSRFDVQLNQEYSKAVPGRTLYADAGDVGSYQYAQNGRVIFKS